MSRRGNNEGSIGQRKDGRWESRIDLGYGNGKRRRKSIYGETRKEVQEKLTRALRARQLGLPVESDRLTVGDWLTQWLGMQKPPATKPKTYEAYEGDLRIHLIPAFGNRPLVKLQPQEVREFMRREDRSRIFIEVDSELPRHAPRGAQRRDARRPDCCGAPGVTRTRDLLVRSQTLYPTELRALAQATNPSTVANRAGVAQPAPPSATMAVSP
jgi:hypothetical protein